MDEIITDGASTVEADADKSAAPSQESKRSEKEKAAFTLKKLGERAKELGLDPAEILGVKTHIEPAIEDEDSKPVTVGMLRDIQKKDAQATALQLAESIGDEETKQTVKQYLTDRIKPSGNSEEDFRLALAAASASKNKLVIEEMSRFVSPKRTAAGGSAQAKVEEPFTATAEEARFMQPPYNVSQEKILAARKAAADKQQ